MTTDHTSSVGENEADRFESTEPGESLAPSTAYRLLSNVHRRFVLYVLQSEGGRVSVDELASRFTAQHRERANDADPGATDVRVQLHHKWLPALAEHGVVRYDPGTGRVELAADAGIDTFLRVARSSEDEPLPTEQ